MIRKVLIKQIITEKSKQHLKDNFKAQKRQLEQECQQLLFERRKLQNKHHLSKQEVTRRFEQQINRRQEQMKILDFKLEQLDMLEIGSEIVEKEVEALVEVRVGANWADVMGEKAIVLKDGVVVRVDE